MKKLSLAMAALFILQVAAFAASDASVTVKFDEPVTVATYTLAPGTYKLTWTEPGPDTKVTFTQGKKSLAVVPATVTSKKNPDFMMYTATAGSGKVLQGFDLKNASLSFTTTTSAK